jgi:tetratricopeptide (TPR) repeat protein
VLSELEVNPPFSPVNQAKLIGVRADASLALQQTDQACASFAQSDEKNGRTWVFLGDIERIADHQSEAAAAYATALKYNPENIDALLGRAAASINANKPEEAASDLDAVLKIANGHPIANHLRGFIQYGQGNYADAKKFFEQALTADPGYFPAILSLGYANYAQKNFAQAESQFARYVAEYPGAVQVQALRALSQARTGWRPRTGGQDCTCSTRSARRQEWGSVEIESRIKEGASRACGRRVSRVIGLARQRKIPQALQVLEETQKNISCFRPRRLCVGQSALDSG